MKLYASKLINNKNCNNITKINPYLLYYFFINLPDSRERLKNLKIFENTKFESYQLLKNLNERYDELIKQYESMNFNVKKFKAKLIKNAVPGLGIESRFETGINLHPIYGFPYFSSSSIKGIASDYALFFKNIKENDINYINVFGNPEKQGKVIFLDALPLLPEENGKFFDIDIITVHYQEYYSGSEYPADYLQPNPIPFLVIRKGVEFNFILISKDKNCLDMAEDWVKNALENIGLGAKTTSGFGYFKILEDYKK